MVAEHSEEESDESIYQLEEVGAVSHQQAKLFTTALHIIEEMGRTSIQCQLDTGATCNVMTLTDLCVIKQHGNPKMESTTAKLRLYDGTIIPVIGEATLKGQWEGARHRLQDNLRQTKTTFVWGYMREAGTLNH